LFALLGYFSLIFIFHQYVLFFVYYLSTVRHAKRVCPPAPLPSLGCRPRHVFNCTFCEHPLMFENQPWIHFLPIFTQSLSPKSHRSPLTPNSPPAHFFSVLSPPFRNMRSLGYRIDLLFSLLSTFLLAGFYTGRAFFYLFPVVARFLVLPLSFFFFAPLPRGAYDSHPNILEVGFFPSGKVRCPGNSSCGFQSAPTPAVSPAWPSPRFWGVLPVSEISLVIDTYFLVISAYSVLPLYSFLVIVSHPPWRDAPWRLVPAFILNFCSRHTPVRPALYCLWYFGPQTFTVLASLVEVVPCSLWRSGVEYPL